MILVNEYLFFGVVIFLITYYYFTRNFNYWKKKNVFFEKPIPFFGNMISGITMRVSMGEILHEFYQKTFEPVLGFFTLNKPCLLIRNPKIIKRILITDFQYFYDRSVANNKRDDPIGTYNLFILKNPDWKDVRSRITPVFTSSKMKTMSALIKEASSDMVDYLHKRVEKNSVVEMKEVCLKFMVDLITSTIFGIRGNAFKEDSQFLTEAKRIINWSNFMTAFRIRCYFLAESFVKLFRMKLFDPISVEFLEKSFYEIMNQRISSKDRRNDLIDILIQMKNDDKHFIEGDILVAQAVVFFTAGFETSSSTTGFALHELAHNPEIQTKLRNEIDAVVEKYGEINYDSLKEMEYLDMCIKEVLRKHPVLAFLERNCNTDYVIPETGTVIDKGTSVFISVLGLHLDPRHFPNPEIFDPSRFSSENKDKIDNCSYLPFGEGPRNCIGARFGLMAVKYGLANILKNFTVNVCSETPKKIKYNPNGITLAAIKGIMLKLEKIEH